MSSARTPIAAMMMSAIALIALAGCATNPPQTAAERENLRSDAQSTLSMMQQKDPDLRSFLDGAYGYAIFPDVSKGGFIAGGASGRGEVYEQGRMIGYTELQQATVGAQAGGQTFSELIVFQNADALRRFTNNAGFKFAANASAVALKAGASASARYENGVAVFTMPKGGLRFEAAIGGQQFTFQLADRINSGASNNAPTTQPSRY